MEKIRKALIHWLGGNTKKETDAILRHSLELGANVTIAALKAQMEQCYGMPAEEWCRTMWDCVDNFNVKISVGKEA